MTSAVSANLNSINSTDRQVSKDPLRASGVSLFSLCISSHLLSLYNMAPKRIAVLISGSGVSFHCTPD